MFKATSRTLRIASAVHDAHRGVLAANMSSNCQGSTGTMDDCDSLPTADDCKVAEQHAQALRSAATEDISGHLRRSYLYVPCTAERMLEKSLVTNSDVIVYDLEDSVPPSDADKNSARARIAHFLTSRHGSIPSPSRIAMRLNSNTTPFFEEDLLQAMRLPSVRTLVLPKIHSAKDLNHVSEHIYIAHRAFKLRNAQTPPIQFVASIESAKALHNLGEIASWQSAWGSEHGGKLAALLFAAEDYCADTGIIRTPTLQELLYTRSKIVVTAKAFGLGAIDMVCVNYKNPEYLKSEIEDGKRLGFTGKQAIHPDQVDIIQSKFIPSEKEISRALRILKKMKEAHLANRGAAGLEVDGGGIMMEMIDAPMIKQAERTVRIAQAAGLI